MANICIILGKSGNGKSTSIRTLDPKETVIISPLGKLLPFKGGKKLYNTENKNHFQIDSHDKIIQLIRNISTSGKHVKNIIIDDAIYIMRKEFFSRAKESGFNKFVEVGNHFQLIISECEKARENLNIFLILHAEEVYNDNVIVGYKACTIGKMVEEKYNPIEVVTNLLFSDVRFKEDGTTEYGFYTRKVKKGTTEIPAKTADGLFQEEFIPNDLAMVVKAMEDYY